MNHVKKMVIFKLIFFIALTACNGPINEKASTPTPTVDVPDSAPWTQIPNTPISKTEMPVFQPTPTPFSVGTEISSLPTGPLTIVAIGDSLTQGDGDESGQGGYPARLNILISSRRPGSQLINLGKSGWTSSDLLNGVNGEAAIIPQALAANPDIAVVWIGSNDLWYLYEYGPDPMTVEAEQQDLVQFQANIESIISQLTGSGARVFIALLDDQSKRPVVANPSDPAQPAFPATTTKDLTLMSAHVLAFNEIIQKIATQYNAVTVDFYHTDIFSNPATLYSDGNHPNTTGYEIITKAWFDAIQPGIK